MLWGYCLKKLKRNTDKLKLNIALFLFGFLKMTKSSMFLNGGKLIIKACGTQVSKLALAHLRSYIKEKKGGKKG